MATRTMAHGRVARRARWAALAACGVLASSTVASGGVWTSHGPTGGIVEAVAVDPTNASVVYAGTSGGGIFKSVDGGLTWTASSAGIPTPSGFDITSLAVDPVTPSRVYASTGRGLSDGIFRSTDAGAHWTFVPSGFSRAIAIDPGAPSTLYAAGFPDILKSTDAGSTWVPVKSSSSFSVAIDQAAPSTVYVGEIGSIVKTTDGGASWTRIGSGITGSEAIQAIAIDPTASNVLYAGMFGNGVFKSVDAGDHWTKIGPTVGTESFSVDVLEIDPVDPAIVYAGGFASITIGGFGVFKSTDAGAHWTGTPLPASAHGLGFIGSGALVAGTQDLGIFRTTDGATTWTPANTGLANTSVLSLATDPAHPGTVYAGTDRNSVSRSADAGDTWITTTPFFNQGIVSVAIDPSAPGTAYAGDAGTFHVLKTVDAGVVWSTVTGPDGPLDAYGLLLDPSNPSIVYAGGFGGFFVSPDGGASWTAMNDGLFPVVFSLAMDASAPGTFYAGTLVPTDSRTGVFKTTDGGGQWTTINTGLPTVGDGAIVALAVDPTTPGIVYAAIEKAGIFKTSDGGASWSAVNDGLGSLDVTSVAVDTVLPNTIYAGTRDQGVFGSGDGGASWVALNDGLFNSDVRSLAVEPGRVYAGTTGNGTFVMAASAITTTTTSTTVPTTTSLPAAILGSGLTVRDPKPGESGDPAKRKIVAAAKEPVSAAVLDRAALAANGATMTITLDDPSGEIASSQTFALPPPWTLVGSTGVKYRDATGANGPVKSAILKRSSAGGFELKVVVLGKLGAAPQPHVVVVPPNPGGAATLVFQVAGGASYCIGFGGAAGGHVVNLGASTFKVSKPTAAVCP